MKTAYFSLSFGLSGCYMPDSFFGTYAVTTRKEIASAIRDAIEFYDLPESLVRQVKLNRLFDFGKRHGFSSMHFDIVHNGNALHFGGMTADEFDAENQD